MTSPMPVATALLCVLICVSTLEIDKSDGGYRDLLISINKNVPYNETIVVNIKKLLRNSSFFLHHATDGLVYFKHVTINFPSTWPERSSARRLSETLFEKSDVRIDLPAKSPEQELAFTKQSTSCGKPGEYIQLAPTFLTELDDSTTKTFGNPAYVFVHEWAHYRYGVFDEYGHRDDDKYPLIICEYNRAQGVSKVRINACSSTIAYIVRSTSGGVCLPDGTTCRYSKDCVFKYTTGGSEPAKSSIMFMPYVANISHFCDSTNGTRQHNRFAPSEQNARCKGRSTWEVISENEDFKNLARANMSKHIEVTFEETQHIEDLPPRVVLVLDVSQSMIDFNRLIFLKEAATRYIQDIPDGSIRIAIITFSTTAVVRHPLSPVNASTKPSFLDVVNDLEHDYSTCIGCGLQQALQVLNTTDESPEGAIIVLMSDGQENTSPRIVDVLPGLLAAKVEVTTMAMGASADYQIEDLATMTSGKAFFFPDLRGNTAIVMEIAFVESSTTQAGADNDYVRIANFEDYFTTIWEEKFILEPTLGNNTVVIIDQLMDHPYTDVLVTLIDPSGQECKMCVEQEDIKTKKILIPSPAQDGEWTIRLESPYSQQMPVYVQVKSQAKDPNDEPIRVKCRMQDMEVAEPNGAIILADVYKGKKIVLDAMVVAEVIGPNPPHKTTVPLLDDGSDPDIRKNDGTYSGYFVQYTGRGRYVVTAHVLGNNKTRESNPKFSLSSFDSTSTFAMSPDTWNPGYFKEAYSPAEESPRKPTGAFQRIVFASSFLVTEPIMQSDVPPGDIWNPEVVQVRSGANHTLEVQVSWKWPGAHMTFGNASAVDIRASRDVTKLDKEFEKQKRMTAADVVQGNLDPLPAGRKHEVTLMFPSEWGEHEPSGALSWAIFLAARVANSDGLTSNRFHIMRVLYLTPPARTTGATTTTVATTTVSGVEGKPKSRGLSQPLVWFLISGIAVVVVIAAVLVVLSRSSAKNHIV